MCDTEPRRPATADEARCKVLARSDAHACHSARTPGASCWVIGGVSNAGGMAWHAWRSSAWRRGQRVRAACCCQDRSGSNTSSNSLRPPRREAQRVPIASRPGCTGVASGKACGWWDRASAYATVPLTSPRQWARSMASACGAGFRPRKRGGIRCSPTHRCRPAARCWIRPTTPWIGSCLP